MQPALSPAPLPAPPALPPDEISVWLVEDNDLYRRTIAGLINETDGMACPVAVAQCEDALTALDDLVPEIVLMDIGLPGVNGIEGTRRLRALSPASRVIMLTVHEEDEKVFDAICAGASGYLLKPSSADQIVEAIKEVRNGAAPINAYIARKMLDMFARLAVPRTDYGLSEREKEILHGMVDGLTMRQIAERLHLSYHTIDTHVRNIYDKLHVHSRSGVVAKALKERLL
jgi:DNA-binding NarL/FixJ family response regulator